MPATTPTATPPGPATLAAFGATESRILLAGGRGLTWRSGDVVLRPAGEPTEAIWKSDVLERLPTDAEFTVPRPIRADDGSWMHDGWQALEWVPGAADETRVDDVVRAGLAFHRALAHEPRPDFIATSDDRWSIADRLAWGDDEATAMPVDPLLEALIAEYRPVTTRAQVIHGDLLGNVLFAPGRPPAVIDWAPYWRPPGVGAAIAVADAACWHGFDVASLADDRRIPEWRQLLLRALAFRITTQHLLGRWDAAFARRHEPVVATAIAL